MKIKGVPKQDPRLTYTWDGKVEKVKTVHKSTKKMFMFLKKTEQKNKGRINTVGHTVFLSRGSLYLKFRLIS